MEITDIVMARRFRMLRIGYNIRQALQQIWRNKGMSTASVFAITAMLLILGLFFVITVNINLFTEMLKNNYNEVEVFLNDDVKKSDAENIMKKIDAEPGVKSSAYRSKTEAMKIMKARWGENSYLLDSLGDNPLPSSIVVTVDSMSTADNVIKMVKGTDGVEDVKYYQETVKKLNKLPQASCNDNNGVFNHSFYSCRIKYDKAHSICKGEGNRDYEVYRSDQLVYTRSVPDRGNIDRCYFISSFCCSNILHLSRNHIARR